MAIPTFGDILKVKESLQKWLVNLETADSTMLEKRIEILLFFHGAYLRWTVIVWRLYSYFFELLYLSAMSQNMHNGVFHQLFDII